MSDQRPTRQAIEIGVLAVLSGGPSYGYAITKEVAARSGGELSASAGVLYPLLRTMEKEGLVTSDWETVKSERSDKGSEGRRRKWYRLSAKGAKRLEQRLAAHRAWASMIEGLVHGPREEGTP